MMKMFPKFSKKDPKKFFKTLNSRVNNYFKEHKIKKTGNWKLYSKSLIIFAIFEAILPKRAPSAFTKNHCFCTSEEFADFVIYLSLYFLIFKV